MTELYTNAHNLLIDWKIVCKINPAVKLPFLLPPAGVKFRREMGCVQLQRFKKPRKTQDTTQDTKNIYGFSLSLSIIHFRLFYFYLSEFFFLCVSELS